MPFMAMLLSSGSSARFAGAPQRLAKGPDPLGEPQRHNAGGDRTGGEQQREQKLDPPFGAQLEIFHDLLQVFAFLQPVEVEQEEKLPHPRSDLLVEKRQQTQSLQ